MPFRKLQTIRRKSGGYINDEGYYVPGNYEEMKILASVQPLNKNDREQQTLVEPQGGRTANRLKAYTATELFAAKQHTDKEGDVLLWHNRLWRCISCEPFQSGVISHYRATFQEIDADTGEEIQKEGDDEG